MDAVRLAVDTGLFILIWLVQTVIYPSFEQIDRSRFDAFHRRYSRVISMFVIPLMFTQVGVHGLLVARSAAAGVTGPEQGIAALMILLAWIVTFFLSVPCHRALSQRGNDPQIVRRLVRTNWLRTVAWTIVWLLTTWKSMA